MTRQEIKTAVALGNFDGAHIGHAAVLRAAADKKTAGMKALAVMFDVHPAGALFGAAPTRLLSDNMLDEILRDMGVCPVRLSFSEIRDMSPERFVSEVLIGRLSAAFVSVGWNFTFGKGAAGKADDLVRLCEKYGAECSVIPAVEYLGEPVSSTRIRRALADGRVAEAGAMLGRPFGYGFEVVRGDALGRKMGFPTLNQYFSDGFTVPKRGVYVSETEAGGRRMRSVTNIGGRPTVGGTDVRSETYIHGFSGDLYGKNVRVFLLDFLREEIKFASVDALRAQIEADVRAAAEWKSPAAYTENRE